MKIQKIKGRAWVFGDNIDTDQIIQGRYLTMLDYSEMAKHTFEILRPEFSEKVNEGDILVAGQNFGMGSSREEAPRVLKELGISCIVADSFARIFYRNAFNIGIPALKVKGISDFVSEGDILEIDIRSGRLKNITKGESLEGESLPDKMIDYLRLGGAVQWYKKTH